MKIFLITLAVLGLPISHIYLLYKTSDLVATINKLGETEKEKENISD
jgi:hypothetical protein